MEHMNEAWHMCMSHDIYARFGVHMTRKIFTVPGLYCECQARGNSFLLIRIKPKHEISNLPHPRVNNIE